MSDTLSINRQLITQWQQDDHFNYDRELVGDKRGVFSWLTDHLKEFLSDLLNTTVSNDAVTYLLIAIGGFALLFVGWQVWRHNPGLFSRQGSRRTLDYDVEDDSIYGVDFEENIRKALASADYRQAVRWLYLQTLSQLSDNRRIDWQPHKTPTEYMREAGNDAFSQMSRHFMQVRYGNFEASEQLFQEMRQLQMAIWKGGDGL